MYVRQTQAVPALQEAMEAYMMRLLEGTEPIHNPPEDSSMQRDIQLAKGSEELGTVWASKMQFCFSGEKHTSSRLS